MTEHEPYVPLGPTPEPEPRAPRPSSLESSTAWVWSVAVVVLAQALVLVIAVALRLPLTWSLLLVIAAAGLFATLSLAGRDRVELETRGFDALPQRLIALVPIVWLLLRARAVWPRSHQGYGPFWLNAVSGVVAYALFTVVVPTAMTLRRAELYWLNFGG
jgi:hypothetical protein